MTKRLIPPAYLSVTFVWFTTLFGGGFASGREIAEFFVSYGWYAAFFPILAMGINALIFYYAWHFSIAHKTFDYRSWAMRFYYPYEKIFANLYEGVFFLTMILATAVAFATGGSTLEEVLGTPYFFNTLLIAGFIFFLTIFGANLIRNVATLITLFLVLGILMVYGSNLLTQFSSIRQVITQLESTSSLGSALWRMILFASLQALALGALVAVADVLKDKADAKRAAIAGFILNSCLISLASLTLLAHYPGIITIPVPTIYMVRAGLGGAFTEGLISILILLGVISTGVNFVFGGVRRLVAWWPTEGGSTGQRKLSIMGSFIYVLITWSVALMGLIPLVSKGYVFLGYLGLLFLIIPIAHRLIRDKGEIPVHDQPPV